MGLWTGPRPVRVCECWGRDWTEVVAVVAALAIAVAATPAGISGAVLLLPFQVSVLGTLSPALIRRLIGVLVIAIGARYLWSGLT